MRSPWLWRGDDRLRDALLVGLLLRVVPMLVWVDKPCLRDECTYVRMADAMLDGRGVVPTHGWLWAPAYPALMALHGALTGYPASVQVTQLVCAGVTTWLLHALGEELFGVDDAARGRAVGRAAAWLYVLNPTFVFYTSSVWSEVIYATLLVGATRALLRARDGSARAAALAGVCIGACVLLRGIATYMLPVLVVALVAGRGTSPAAWRSAAALVLSAALVVAPYSAWASWRFGGLVVSDRTLGQMMWSGNNVFPPLSYDYGNGILNPELHDRIVALGRVGCDTPADPVRQDACELRAGLEWIQANPGEFLARAPLRVSQMVTPHSFLTRHLRLGRWHGLPAWAREALIVAVPVFTGINLVIGTLGFFAYATDPERRTWALATGGVVLYHVAAIAALAGLSRFRLPLEPLWMVWAAAALTRPREAAARLGSRRPFVVFGLVVTAILLVLMARFAPAAWWPRPSHWWLERGW